jgi:Patatin-like phospholipase
MVFLGGAMTQILHRVLSFDGGGIRGLYHSKLLESLKEYGLDVAQRADIVAGTSTGAIVAAALAMGKQPETISALYTDIGEKVFPPRWRITRAVVGLAGWVGKSPSYLSSVLREALEQQLGKNTTLGECEKRLMIPAISLNQYKLKVFDSTNESDKKKRLVDVVLASAGAPTYFLPAKVGDSYYVDGGLCCNNPGFRAAAALFRDGVDLSRIYLLSISTGAVPVTKAGIEFMTLRQFNWIRPIIDIAMSGSSDLAVQDGELVGYHCRVTESFESEVGLDDYEKAVAILPPLAEGKANEVRASVTRWFDGPARTGLDFSGTWQSTFTWGEPVETGTDTLRIEQCGDHIVGETVGPCRWPYTLSGTVSGEVCIGAWKGPILQGSFLLIMSKENRTVSGKWVGTGDAKPYFGEWLWTR